jgi:hypothetical protein
MFTFSWHELLVVIIGGLILFLGLALVMLRRRNEILQVFLTPEDPNIEENFFRVRKEEQQEPPPEEYAAESETSREAEDTPDENAVQWGTKTENNPLPSEQGT